jgi:ribose 1,5-bisphosphokinase PhnN
MADSRRKVTKARKVVKAGKAKEGGEGKKSKDSKDSKDTRWQGVEAVCVCVFQAYGMRYAVPVAVDALAVAAAVLPVASVGVPTREVDRS